METKKLTLFISIACAIAIICNGVVLLVLYTDLRSNQTGIGNNITVTEIQRTAQTSFQTYVKENEGETKKLQTLISELVTNLTQMEADVAKNEGETRKLRTRYEGETTKLQTRISVLETGSTSETTKLQTRISALETGSTKLETDVASETTNLQTRISALETGSTKMEADVAKNEGENTKLQTRISALETDSRKLETDVAKNEGETTKLRTRISVLETGSAKMEADVAKNEGETTKLQTRISALETGSTKNEGETTKLQTRISALETGSRKLKTDVAKNEGETTKLRTRISLLEAGSRKCSLPSNVKGTGYSSRKNEFMNNEVVNLSCLDSTYAPSGTSSYTCKNGQFDPTITFKCTKLRYTLKRTPSTGTFDEASKMCNTMGGRLIQECLYKDVAGHNYENEIKSLCSGYCWIGAKYVSSKWKYLEGGNVFPGCTCSDVTGLVANWSNGQVEDSSGEECADIIVNTYGYIVIYDTKCSYIRYGLCEIRT